VRLGISPRWLAPVCWSRQTDESTSAAWRWYSLAMKLIFNWLLSAAALLAVAYLYSGVVVTSFTSALVAAAVLGALNMVVRPILILLTLPVTVITLGLFLFFINALMFWAAASLLSGLDVRGFGAALVGSLIYSGLQLAIDFVLESLFPN
jgi:putative membrane protein